MYLFTLNNVCLKIQCVHSDYSYTYTSLGIFTSSGMNCRVGSFFLVSVH